MCGFRNVAAHSSFEDTLKINYSFLNYPFLVSSVGYSNFASSELLQTRKWIKANTITHKKMTKRLETDTF